MYVYNLVVGVPNMLCLFVCLQVSIRTKEIQYMVVEAYVEFILQVRVGLNMVFLFIWFGKFGGKKWVV